MGDSRDDNKQIPLAGLFAVFAALSVIFFNKLPLKESRPDIREVPEYHQKVQARLWQDPFQAVLDGHGENNDSESNPFYLYSKEISPDKLPTSTYNTESGQPSSLFKAIKKKLGKEEKVTVVGVMVYGAPYAEEREVRIRSRYAAVSALSRLGFVPDDAEHLGYEQLSLLSEGGSPRKTLSMGEVMPYEWFRNNKNRESILLLWLNDDLFKDDNHPLRNITYLSINLRENQDYPVPLKIIGPAGGGTLRRMLKEISELKGPEGGGAAVAKTVNQPPIEIYSARATVDDRTLIDTLPDKDFIGNPAQCLEERFNKAGFYFKRTICSDRELAEKLFAELKSRGIDCRDGRNHIALISESDTYFGRSLATRYRSVFLDHAVLDPAHQIHSFSYIRGIDGKLPLRPGSGGATKDDKESTTGKADPALELERASGLSQFDYVRRLAEQIHDYEQSLGEGETIRAIGILGSDFHDKYLVLQALRQRFPQAVFFTTDLDARMLHPEALPSTRNLLVASSFDLNLRSEPLLDLQGGSPPFRDSYQTSIFFTILKSFRGSAAFNAQEQRALDSKPEPKIFEIGKTRAVDLSEDPLQQGGFDPQPREAADSLRVVGKVVAILLLLILLLSLSSVCLRRLLHSVFHEKKSAFAGTAFFLLLVLSAFVFRQFILLAPHQEEPFSFLEGVSVWPTEMLRLTAVILSFYFIWRGSIDISKNNRQIARRFRLWRRQRRSKAETQAAEPMGEVLWTAGEIGPPGMEAGAEVSSSRRSRTKIVPDLRAMFGAFANVTTYAWRVEAGNRRSHKWSGPPPHVEDYWGEYLRRDSLNYRIRRLAPIMASYFALCWLIISFGRPEPPVRGVLSMTVDKVVLALSVVAVVTIIFYAFDVIKTCRRFTELLAEHPPKWPESSYVQMFGQHADSAREPMSEWMLVELIAARTEVVGKIIFYPFIICFIISAARANYFDNWRTPLGLLFVIGIGAAYAWSCAVVLRRAAEETRKAALNRLLNQQAMAVANGDQKQQLKPLGFALDAIQSIKTGAFAPLSQNPVVQALMVPFGGVGGYYALDFLSKLNV